ncbi:GatB/YqeY domain-containing protein [Aliikangiella coralliicola]|uniref:GatB/YqeY domain-containing protein n=1 Tax=Aliikangiella coralliicola TaxID=2592383 RepID=A0A545UE18_9GAMM|nr:GatB/YqeY domain-containing protein [Aliikangiella coralliicola]TQV87712.1 GatB/YqeY domain-containing protein [Aliikangiella coralliicola]
MSTLVAQIKDGMKEAMRAKDKVRLTAIRMLLAQIKQIEVDERREVTDTDVLAALDKMIKQRKDSIEQFEAAGRNELADNEKQEIEALQAYLPQALSESEINNLVESAIAESGAESMRDMGKVMAILKPQMQGRADMSAVSGQVKAKLS